MSKDHEATPEQPEAVLPEEEVSDEELDDAAGGIIIINGEPTKRSTRASLDWGMDKPGGGATGQVSGSS